MYCSSNSMENLHNKSEVMAELFFVKCSKWFLDMRFYIILCSLRFTSLCKCRCQLLLTIVTTINID